MTMASNVGLVLVLVIFNLHHAYCHPQCLTGGPPMFPDWSLEMCNEYSKYGCCRPSYEEPPLVKMFTQLKNEVPTELWSQCSHFIRDFLCQRCSPYAAHLFDLRYRDSAENLLPGLCPQYCKSFHTTCLGLLPFLVQDRKRLSLMLQQASLGATQFCEMMKPVDPDYCYSNISYNAHHDFGLEQRQKTVPGCLCVEEVASNLRNPLLAVPASDGSKRLFIGEQQGKVYVLFANGTLSKMPFIDIQSKIVIGKQYVDSVFYPDERGLLGMAFHPRYYENGRFFVVYTRKQEKDLILQLSEFLVSAFDPNKADPNSEKRILGVHQPFINHNGGQILFRSDNYLYFLIGDGGNINDPLQTGQNLSTLLGKMIRIDVDTNEENMHYGIPPDNPFFDSEQQGIRREIYAYGLRNPWRCGMDRGDPESAYGRGRIICGDVGQGRFEELNLIESGRNYGWSKYEGPDCFIDSPTACKEVEKDGRLTFPILSYNHTVGKCIIGGHFYRGSRSPRLNGFFFFADLETSRLFRIKENRSAKTWEQSELTMCGKDVCKAPLRGYYHPSVLSFGEDEEGEVYILSTSLVNYNATSGSIYRIVDPVVKTGRKMVPA